MPTACEKLPPASCFMKENLLGRAAKRSQPPAGCFRRTRWRMRGHGGPAGLGGEWGDGDGSCWVCESRRQVVLKDKTSCSLPCLGGQSLLCLCCLERGSFSVGLGMLSSMYSPQQRKRKAGIWLVSCHLGAGCVTAGQAASHVLTVH